MGLRREEIILPVDIIGEDEMAKWRETCSAIEVDSQPTQSHEPDRQMRFDSGKPQLSYLLAFPNANEMLSRVMEYGATKYAPYNFRRGCDASQSVNCLMRHLSAWWNGEDLDRGKGTPEDPGSGVSHLGHVIFNALQLAEQFVLRPELDDRPHKLLANQKKQKTIPFED